MCYSASRPTKAYIFILFLLYYKQTKKEGKKQRFSDNSDAVGCQHFNTKKT